MDTDNDNCRYSEVDFMTTQERLFTRYPGLKKMVSYIWRNPQLWLASVLFIAGLVAISNNVPALAGALFGAGATMLGAWITEWNRLRTVVEEKLQRQGEARQYLAPELHRVIERVLFIHGRATANFICASADNNVKPNDLKQDFVPFWPVLYPNAPQVRDLSGRDAVALIAFYDSLHTLAVLVNDWWKREGQLPVNIFNSILHQADDSLKLALSCIENFELERLCPPRYEAWGTLSSRILRSRSSSEDAMNHHLARFEGKAKANNQTSV
jgi:hypothetical protein